jgi:hypothetical protein
VISRWYVLSGRVEGETVLEPAENGVVDNIHGCAHNQNVAKANVENDLRGQTGVRAAKDDCERVLAAHQLAASEAF